MANNNINNLPFNVITGEFVVERECDEEFWFYGNYKSDLRKANEVASQIDGVVIKL